MTLKLYLRLGLAASLISGATGCHSCGSKWEDRPGLFGWRERARERERRRELDRELDPMRPRLEEPVRPFSDDRIPPPEIPIESRRPAGLSDPIYSGNSDIGPSPGSWVGPPIQSHRPPRQDLPPWPSESKKITLEPDPLPAGPSGPPAVLDLPPLSRSSNRPTLGYLEDPIPPVISARGQAPVEKSPDQPASDLPPRATNELPPLPEVISRSDRPAEPANNEPTRPDFSGRASLPSLYLVPGFKDVYSGRKPALDGFDRLKENGVRTVVYLHEPRADLSAPRGLAEKAGLSFQPIEVDPARLRTASQRFAEAIADSSKRPVFVYDDIGSRAGVLWYLYFRDQQLSDDIARVRSGPLGLSSLTMVGEDLRLWQAAQSLVK